MSCCASIEWGIFDFDNLRLGAPSKIAKDGGWHGHPEIIYIDIDIESRNAHSQQFRFSHFGTSKFSGIAGCIPTFTLFGFWNKNTNL